MSFTPDPVAFSVFGLDIRWYAVLICTGILLAGFIGLRRGPAAGRGGGRRAGWRRAPPYLSWE